jgi:hypothetical protein
MGLEQKPVEFTVTGAAHFCLFVCQNTKGSRFKDDVGDVDKLKIKVATFKVSQGGSA